MPDPAMIENKYTSVAGHGVDVAVVRADDLDRKLITALQGKPRTRILDLGSGAGGQSLRLAHAGARVTAVDLYDFSDAFAALRQQHSLSETQLHFVQGDIARLAELLSLESYDFAYLQRTLHYLPYHDAKKLLQYLRSVVTGKLFVSVSGLATDLAIDYGVKNKAVADRFELLSKVVADTFSITEPVCLYHKAEFETLLEATGWQIEESWQSAFGNIKVICS